MDEKIEIKYFTFCWTFGITILLSLTGLCYLVRVAFQFGTNGLALLSMTTNLFVLYALLAFLGLISWIAEILSYKAKILPHFSIKISAKVFEKLIIALVVMPILSIFLPSIIAPIANLNSKNEQIESQYTQPTPQENQAFYQETMPEVKKVAPKELPKSVIKYEDIKFNVDLGRCRKLTAKWNPPYVKTVHNVTFKVIVSPHGQTEILMTSSSGNKEFDNSAQDVLFSMRNNVAQCLPYGQAGHTFLTFSSCPRFKVVMSD